MHEQEYSERWQKARKSGEKSEKELAKYLRASAADPGLLHRLVLEDRLETIQRIGSKHFACISGGPKVAPKADIVAISGGNRVGISVKKSAVGQLGLYSVDTFCDALARRYSYPADSMVKEFFSLFVGENQAAVVAAYGHGAQFKASKKIIRMSALDQRMYRRESLEAASEWLKNGMHYIARFGFADGTCSEGSADYIWYYSPRDSLDAVCAVTDIVDCCRMTSFTIVDTEQTDISLPFGGLSAHQGCIQLRHSYRKVRDIGVSFR